MNYQKTIKCRKEKKSFAIYKKILLAFYALISSGASYAEAAEALNKQGIKTPTGRDWTAISAQVTTSRLNDDSYTGWIAAARDELVEQGLITNEQQAAMKVRSRYTATS